MRELLEKFKVCNLKIELVAIDELQLPDFKGSTIRGGFGAAFKRIACRRFSQSCGECMLKENCPYAYVFETSPNPGGDFLIKFNNVPRPFIIRPPHEDKQVYNPGESMIFELVVIGNGINYIPYFILTFEELGKDGLGKGRGKFALKAVTSVDPLNGGEKEIYNGEEKIYYPDKVLIDFEKYIQSMKTSVSNRCSIVYKTMTKIKYADKYVNIPEFHIVFRNVLRRLGSLLYFHCDYRLDINYTELIEKSQLIRLAKDQTFWRKCTRYSKRQDARLDISGFIGEAHYQGHFEEFLLYLLLGQFAHVGKGCVFGLGEYEVKWQKGVS